MKPTDSKPDTSRWMTFEEALTLSKLMGREGRFYAAMNAVAEQHKKEHARRVKKWRNKK